MIATSPFGDLRFAARAALPAARLAADSATLALDGGRALVLRHLLGPLRVAGTGRLDAALRALHRDVVPDRSVAAPEGEALTAWLWHAVLIGSVTVGVARPAPGGGSGGSGSGGSAALAASQLGLPTADAVATTADASGGPASASAAGAHATAAAARPAKPKEREKTSWIEIVFTGENGRPIADVAYEITCTPSGSKESSVKSGRFPADGTVHIDGIAEATCELRLPGLDADAWLLHQGGGRSQVLPSSDPPETITVKPGEGLTFLAEKHGRNASSVWDANAELRAKRSDLNLLAAGDRVVLPGRRARIAHLRSGVRHVVQRRGIPAILRLRLLGRDRTPRVGERYTLAISQGPTLSGLTDRDGVIQHYVPAATRQAELSLARDHAAYRVDIGALPPIDGPRGVACRLANLGYLADADAAEEARVACALRAFQGDHGLEASGTLDAATRTRLGERSERLSASVPAGTVPLAGATRLVVHAFLQDSSGPADQGTVHALAAPVLWYVIVGSGMSAVANHLTLRHSRVGRDRLRDEGGRDLPVLHIGFGDPWAQYGRLAMGQDRNLLVPPGYHQQPADSPGERFLRADRYAAATAAVLADLMQHGAEPGRSGLPQISRAAANVIAIEPAGHVPKDKEPSYGPWLVPSAPYRVILDRAVPDFGRCVYAERVDVCTGAGMPRTWQGWTVIQDTGLAAEYTRPIPAADQAEAQPRRVLPAQCSMYAGLSKPHGKRVLVVGGGTTAMWCAEQALANGNEVWWAADTLLGGFPKSRRNHHHLKLADPAAELSEPLTPADPRLHLVMPATITAIAPAAGRSVRVTWGPIVDRDTGKVLKPCATVSWEADGGTKPLPVEFDQAISSMAQITGPKEPGSVTAITGRVGDLKAIIADDGRLVGLQSMDGHVRVLGAAGFLHAQARSVSNAEPYEATGEFEGTLPFPAHVTKQGITLCALCVALANGFFDAERPLTNRNVVADGDLPKEWTAEERDLFMAHRTAQPVLNSMALPSNVPKLPDKYGLTYEPPVWPPTA